MIVLVSALSRDQPFNLFIIYPYIQSQASLIIFLLCAHVMLLSVVRVFM